MKASFLQRLGAVAALAGSLAVVNAANIVWVTDNTPEGFSGPVSGFPEANWLRLLTNNHRVQSFNPPNDPGLLTAEHIAALNTNDLIIIGRSINSAAFQGTLHPPQWNVEITKPIICINAYIVRNVRLGWCTGGTLPDGTPTPVTAVDLNDPATAFLFDTVTMNGNTTAYPYDEALGRNISQIVEGPVAGGRILATASYVDLGGTARTSPIIMEWPAGVAVRGGADVLGGYRLYISGGDREPNGGSVPQAGSEIYTPTGETLFMNAVELALAGGQVPGDPTWPVGFRQQPLSVTVNENEAVSFTAIVTGAPPKTLQWQRDDGAGGWTNIPLATGSYVAIPRVTPADNGAQFRLTVQNSFSGATSEVATLTVITDTTAPEVIGVNTPANFTNVIVRFSEKVVITDTLNFLSDNLLIRDMRVDASGSNVVLTVDPIQPGGVYALGVEGLNDLAATPNTLAATNLTVLAPVLSCGYIRGDYFQNVTTASVDDLIAHPKFPGNVDETIYYASFNSRSGYAETYGLRMWGWFVPPTNGNYTFYIRSDDHSRLYISSNEDPANKTIVAIQNGANVEYTNTAGGTPRFGTVQNMVGGQRYYMEALLREGTGGDYITVVAKAEGEPWPVSTVPATVNPIPGDWFCSYADPNGVAITITNQPQSVTAPPGTPATFTVGADIRPLNYRGYARYQWQKDGVDIPGATAATYSIAATTPADRGTYTCVIRVPTLTVTSEAATLDSLVTPTIGVPSLSGGVISFEVPTVAGPEYIIQYSDTLPALNWLPLTNAPGTGVPLLIYDTVTANPQRFYRVRVE